MNFRQLLVTTSAQTIGNIRCDMREEKFELDYYDPWRASPQAFPLSPNLPLDGLGIKSRVTTDFIANMLPEGDIRRAVSETHKLSLSNIAALAHLFGHEPAGAATFIWHGHNVRLPSAQEPIFREISNDELTERIKTRYRHAFAFWDGKYFQSLAGVQDKMQVLATEERIYLVTGSLNSTHILKPETRNPNTPFLVANEHYSMSLAAAVGLSVASVQIRRTPEPILLIERFDRTLRPGKDGLQRGAVERLHIIDGCQALGQHSWFKYECPNGHNVPLELMRAGIGFKKLFGLQPHFVDNELARMFMVRWGLFNLIICNSDAHAKNISFFQTESGLMPAPMYDLVSVGAYGRLVIDEMAMAFGDQFFSEKVDAKDLTEFAAVAGMSSVELFSELEQLAVAVKEHALSLAASDIYVGEERSFIAKVAALVSAQATRMLGIAAKQASIVQLGLANGKFVTPDDIDITNSEIKEMFNGE